MAAHIAYFGRKNSGPTLAVDSRVTTWTPFVLALSLCACTFDSSTSASFDDFDNSDTPGGKADAGDVEIAEDPDAAPEDVEPIPMLNDEGVIVRYFMNDLPASQVVQDATSDPVNLSLTDPDQSLGFVTTNTHGGLEFGEISDDARASAMAENTKIQDMLDESRTGTIEIVVDVEATIDGSRLSHIGDDRDSGRFSLRAENEDTLSFYFNGSECASWDIDFAGTGRLVLHLVLDTSNLDGDERVILYVNGERRESENSNSLRLGDVLDIDTNVDDLYYVLGNREGGDRSFQGTFYYAAMYSTAMPPDVVEHNAAVLYATDDGAE